MTLTLRDVLDLDAMREVRILAGAGGTGRAVTSATVLDAPDGAAWLRGGELAFTSTYPLIHLGEGFGAFVEKLAAQGASGLGVKLTRYMTSIPADAIDIADRLEFPIISLPEQASWVELINPIITHILNREADRLERSESIHHGFTDRLIASSRLEDLAELLSKMVNNPVVIDCPDDGIMAWSHASLDQEELSGIVNLLRSDASGEKIDFQHGVARKRGRAGSLVCMDLASEIGVDGCIAIVESMRPFEVSDIDCLLHAQKATSIKVLQISADIQVRRGSEDAFVTSLIDSQTAGPARDRSVRSGAAAGHCLISPFQIAVCRLKGIGARRLPFAAKRIQVLLFEEERVLTGFPEPDVMVLIFNDAGEDAPEGILRALFDALVAEFPALHLRGGISQRLLRSEDLPEGYAQAVRILSDETEEAGDAFWLRRLEDISLLRLFSSAAVQPEARLFVHDWLDPLLAHDRKRGGDLVRTLRVFLEANGNHRLAAHRLHLHHNSVRYRMAKIHKLTGHDVTARERRLQYELALSLLPFVDDLKNT